MTQVDIFDDTSIRISPSDQKKLTFYERVIPHLDTLYEAGESCTHPDTGEIVSDKQYDEWRADAMRIDPQNKKIFGGVTASSIVAKNVVVHDPPMTSITKANGELKVRHDRLSKWESDVQKELGIKDGIESWAVQAYKLDGVAVSLYYQDGVLIKAGLRPRDGINGADVTNNIQCVKGVPLDLGMNNMITCSIRGELYCPKSIFEKLNGSQELDGQEFANPRNYTAGSIQLDNVKKVAARQIHFRAYSIENLANPPYKTEIERAKWCNKQLGIPFVRVEPFKIDDLAKLESMVPDLDYEVDGIVLSINNLEDQEQMGREGDEATGNPKGKLAWKFDDEKADVVIKDILWATGRTGKITPVLSFDGKTLAGTVVKQCAGYSVGFLIRNGIKAGTKIRIRKSGKIIPETLGFYDKDGFFKSKISPDDKSLPKTFDLDKTDYPKECPSCGSSTVIEPGQSHGMFELSCTNKKTCPAQNVKTFVHYLQTIGCKGLAESVTEQLVHRGMIKRFADFYDLKISSLISIGLSGRMSLLTIARIHMVNDPEKIDDNILLAKITAEAADKPKKISFSTLIASFGIPGCSKGTGRELANAGFDINSLLTATEKDFEAVDNIGSKSAKNLAAFFEENRDDIQDLIKHIEIEMPQQGRFTGKAFVFTGGMPGGKDIWKEAVELEGGIIKSSVSKKTNIVVVGTDPGSKYDKAKDLLSKGEPIEIMMFNDFKKMVENGS